MSQLLSAQLQSDLRFFQPPLPAPSIAHLAVTPAGIRRDVGLTLFCLQDTNDLVPASNTGSRNIRVLQVSDGSNRLRAFWLEPVSVFGSAGFNGAMSSSRVLDLSFSLTLPPH